MPKQFSAPVGASSAVQTARAILFLQLGGPETLDEVPNFLYRLFSDPEVIRARPALLRKVIAAGIAFGRTKASRKLYASIGGGSPIRRLTEEQAEGTQRILREEGRDAVVRSAMTCSAPLVEDVVRELAGRGVRRFLSFPLYPQYSLTTTKGALDRARGAVRRYALGAALEELSSWPTHPLFVEAHAEGIREELAKFPDPRAEAVHLLFSAHSIPKKLVTKEGDPYEAEVEASVAAILARLAWSGPSSLAYQSKLGPVEWLGPPTLKVIRELGGRRQAQVLVVPIAFVTDHVETLYEIDQLFADEARAAGVAHFRRTRGLNDRPTFLRALADLARSCSRFWAA
ncbi:MAG: ferrochelatase [Thermoanaerobaculia bacterium]